MTNFEPLFPKDLVQVFSQRIGGGDAGEGGGGEGGGGGKGGCGDGGGGDGGGDMYRGPQSVQSVPYAQLSPMESSPPSWQNELFVY